MKYKKVGPGFCLDITTQDDGVDKVNDEVLNIFLQRMVSLAGPTLLNRAPKTSHEEDDKSDSGKDGSDGAEEEDEPNIPSFRSDREL